MAVLYVKEQGAILQKRGERLLVSKNGKSLLEMPLYQIETDVFRTLRSPRAE